MNNTSRNTYIEADGELRTIAQWSKLLGIPSSTISMRIKRGKTGKELLVKPQKEKGGPII
jgi:hypothetical protein